MRRRDEVRDPIAETWRSLSAAQQRALAAWTGGAGVQRKTILVFWDYGLINGANQLTEHGTRVRDHGLSRTP